MPVFQPNVPIVTDAPFVTVENRLEPGTHTFTLVVVDEAGNRSFPARATVTIVRSPLPPPPPPPPATPTRPAWWPSWLPWPH